MASEASKRPYGPFLKNRNFILAHDIFFWWRNCINKKVPNYHVLQGLLVSFSCQVCDIDHAAIKWSVTENHNLRPRVTSEVGSDLIRSPIFRGVLQVLFNEIFCGRPPSDLKWHSYVEADEAIMSSGLTFWTCHSGLWTASHRKFIKQKL